MNHVAKKQQGFTIIELMLAMSFIAVLLIAIAMTIIQIGNIYNKGLTLKEVNQVGRDISEDLRRTIVAGTSVDLENDFVEVKDTPTGPVIGGRLCLGAVSYVWNNAWAIESGHSRVVSKGTEPVRLMELPDSTKAYCVKDILTGVPTATSIPASNVNARELLRAGDRALALHSLKVTTSSAATDTDTGQRLYRVNFTVGTGRTELLNLTNSPINCKTPQEIGSDLNYCTVQDFSIVVRAGSGV